MTTEPSAGRIAGQLAYLFEEQPELRDSSATDLAARLDSEDRASRARAEHPLATDAEVAAYAAALDVRVTEALVAEALRNLTD